MNKRITRRDFLQKSSAAALLAMTGGLPGCTGSTSPASGLRGPNSLPDMARAAGAADPSLPFDHVVVVMMENHSFDNYLGMLAQRGQPAADGFQFDASGQPRNSNPLDGGVQRAFHLQGTCQPGSVTQSWDSTHQQINGGRMDGFCTTSTSAMGYWDESDLPFYYSLAKTFCVGDRCFASAPCQTYPNRRFLYSGTAQGTIATDTSTNFTLPGPANGTLMDKMSQHGVSWRSYFVDLPALAIVPQNLENHPLNFSPMAQFYVDCLTGQLPAVSFVDPEFNILSTVGSPLFGFVKTVTDKIPNLPADVIAQINSLETKYDAQGASEENPDDIAIGEAFVSRIVNAVMASPAWSRTLLVWTYDEHGGYYDHVPPVRVPRPDGIPPKLGKDDIPGDYDITGLRVPTVVVSPYSKPNAVTHVMHDHTSIIATIAAKWNLPALTYRDAQANTLLDFLDLESPPAFLTPPALAAPAAATLGLSACHGTPPTPVIEPAA
ncbi:MAG TPA: alkaline phosphatase family protein [Stenotrophobium sp.]|nr:alkaline phosphatase family protein [Stenotrophobium sp.]